MDAAQRYARGLSAHPSQGDLVQQRLDCQRVVARLQLGQFTRLETVQDRLQRTTRATLAALSAAGSSRTGKVSK